MVKCNCHRLKYLVLYYKRVIALILRNIICCIHLKYMRNYRTLPNEELSYRKHNELKYLTYLALFLFDLIHVHSQ
jgi:hypothetical protein